MSSTGAVRLATLGSRAERMHTMVTDVPQDRFMALFDRHRKIVFKVASLYCWVAANLGFGLAMIPLTTWIARRYSDHGRSPIAARLADDLAGRSLAAARGLLDEIARFEKE